MSPDGDRSRIFKLLYFADKAPDEVRRHWDILVGRQPASGFVLRMHDRDIGTADARVWVEEMEDQQIGLSIYCEKLLPLLMENENQAYGLMYVLLDQAIGELSAIRYVRDMKLLETPLEGDDISLDSLQEYLLKDRKPVAADDLCQWYSAYKMQPSEKEDWDLREDVIAGVTTCFPVISAYYREEDSIMEEFCQDGAVPGFFYYSLNGIPRDEILDFIAWNLTAVLDAAVEVFRDSPVREAHFHTFRRKEGSILMKEEEAPEQG